MKAKKFLTPQAESGMVSAEYAVGTVATTSIAGILIWLVQQDWFREGIAAIFRLIFKYA
ncbi:MULTISPECIES: DUF4244 domain-containing protein [Trueperella]|uniref:DUF4244 domain-containing protein n=1 Tax=Trueperella bernardiae TaxID=59561 RepID=A0A0W1KLX7_9ACTO|nr:MULTISPECIES: DUF4244 domain-containing protein [Trueperella]KTF04637.1 hypothetical protein AQZ59_00626 [Trueperella bernardiae]MCM3907664.1 DUF4244 domain-containing protein [Trueperella bernardiae]MDK8600987.1 DUF4244 domain-containing protein [Trueperella bernardiae]MDV6239670.1 DUF4244 domain-containing protein [Trueperella bernardiae]PKZ89157.1 DUF4244 domain-containing protein [Trueperella bernardiae]